MAAHGLGELDRIERLGDHRDGTERHQPLALCRRTARGDEDHRDFFAVGIFAQPRQHGRPVHVGHQDVEDDEVGHPARHGGEGFRAAAAAHHHEFRIETERELDYVAHQRIVVDMKNAKRFHAYTHV